MIGVDNQKMNWITKSMQRATCVMSFEAFILVLLILPLVNGCCFDGSVLSASDDSLILNDVVKGKYVNFENGKIVESSKYRAETKFVPINNVDMYFTLYNAGGGRTFLYNTVSGAYYDENQAFISGIHVDGAEQIGAKMERGRLRLLIPPNCKFLRISVNDAGLNKRWELHAGNTQEKIKTIVWFGDSIVGDVKNETSVPNCLSVLSGALVYDMGFGGCRMSAHKREWGSFSMYNLSNYIYKDNFRRLITVCEKGWPTMPKYFSTSGRILATEIDFTSVDIIIISFGTNDYTAPSSRLDNENNKYDVRTVCGALRYSVKQIKEKYPDIRIVVTSPTYRFWLDDDDIVTDDSNSRDFGSGTLIKYAGAYEQVCKELGIDFIDLYNDCPITSDTKHVYFSGKDGTHPNKEGRRVIAETVYSYLLRNKLL